MIKRIVYSVVFSIVLSAGLLFLGISLMGNYSPALASSLDALVAGTSRQNLPNALAANDSVSLPADFAGGEKILDVSPASRIVSDLSASFAQPQAALASSAQSQVSDGSIQPKAVTASSVQPQGAVVASPPIETPVSGVTIAELLNNPTQYKNQVVTITGIATSLSKEKILLNDGTGQIQVEVDEDITNLADLNGQSITVTGKLDDSSSQSGIHLEAYTLTDQNGTVFTDDCIDNDSSIDDHDCLNDDCSDDCANDDCSDDDVDDNDDVDGDKDDEDDDDDDDDEDDDD